MKKQLILSNGSVFVGNNFGSCNDCSGELVFTTGMTGYQEVLSDPSFAGQIVTFTYPLIGNYGINNEDFEASQLNCSGVIIKEAAKEPSNWRSKQNIAEFLKKYDIPGLEGVDTRKLTRIIRESYTLKGKMCPLDVNVNDVIEELNSSIDFEENNVEKVSTKEQYIIPGNGLRIVLLDLGVKRSIIKQLVNEQCEVIVVPPKTSVEEIMSIQPDGIVLSNGPGDPIKQQKVVEIIHQILGKIPIFGVGLGYQLLALACGANTRKMKVGHRGANYPVKDLQTGKICITSQNHGYIVERSSVPLDILQITHASVNDDSIEGLAHKKYSAFGVQFYPDTYHNSKNFFKFFVDEIIKCRDIDSLAN